MGCDASYYSNMEGISFVSIRRKLFMSKKFIHEETWPGYSCYNYHSYYPPYTFGSTNNYYGRGGEDSGSYSSCGIRWIYVMLLLIVIVLQFGRNNNAYTESRMPYDECEYCEFNTSRRTNNFSRPGENQLIDNSVLFIIVVFLLVLCGGGWPNK